MITMAFDPDLDDCVVIALRQMIDLDRRAHRPRRAHEAYALCALAGRSARHPGRQRQQGHSRHAGEGVHRRPVGQRQNAEAVSGLSAFFFPADPHAARELPPAPPFAALAVPLEIAHAGAPARTAVVALHLEEAAPDIGAAAFEPAARSSRQAATAACERARRAASSVCA